MKRNIVIAIICFLVGLIFLGLNLRVQWLHSSQVAENNLFSAWIKSKDAQLFLGNSLGTLGINLISSIVFLFFVDRVIQKNADKIGRQIKLESMRREILEMIRTDPLKAISVIKADKENYSLLSGQFLGGCDFSTAILDKMDFTKANLQNCKFVNASLLETNLSGTNLLGADFSGARLTNADLNGAKIDVELLKTVYSLQGTIMPDGRPYEGQFNLQGDIEEAAKLNIDLNTEEGKEQYYGITLDTTK